MMEEYTLYYQFPAGCWDAVYVNTNTKYDCIYVQQQIQLSAALTVKYFYVIWAANKQHKTHTCRCTHPNPPMHASWYICMFACECMLALFHLCLSIIVITVFQFVDSFTTTTTTVQVMTAGTIMFRQSISRFQGGRW